MVPTVYEIHINFQIYGMYLPHANGSTDPQSNWMHYLHSVLHFNLNYPTYLLIIMMLILLESTTCD